MPRYLLEYTPSEHLVIQFYPLQQFGFQRSRGFPQRNTPLTLLLSPHSRTWSCIEGLQYNLQYVSMTRPRYLLEYTPSQHIVIQLYPLQHFCFQSSSGFPQRNTPLTLLLNPHSRTWPCIEGLQQNLQYVSMTRPSYLPPFSK